MEGDGCAVAVAFGIGIVGLVGTTIFLATLIGSIASGNMWVGAIVTGVLEIAAAYRLRSVLRHEWLVAFNGVLSVLFGIFVLLFPGAGALALVWLIGWYAIASGVALLVLAFRLRGHGRLSTRESAA